MTDPTRPDLDRWRPARIPARPATGCEKCNGGVRTYKPPYGWVCTRCIREQKWAESRAEGLRSFAEMERALAPFRDLRSPAELSRLKAEMADAHPDRGGTTDAFIAAHERYVRARRAAVGTA